jgi:hypothetical protein
MTRYIALPVATPEYDRENEQVTRRSLEQSLQDANANIAGNRDKTNKLSSLALRRFQFLLMGAGNG